MRLERSGQYYFLSSTFCKTQTTSQLFFSLALQLKLEAKNIVKEKGLEEVKLEDIVAGITPKGRALVPDAVKRELLARIKDFLAQQENI